MGDQNHARCEETIELFKITHIINVTRHVENKFQNKFVKYLNIPVEDTDTNNLSPYFKQAYDFMEECLMTEELSPKESKISHRLFEKMGIKDISKWRDVYEATTIQAQRNKILQVVFKFFYQRFKEDNRLLIHCSLGVSRSCTIILMYIMRKFKLKLNDAIEFLRFQRESACPILWFQIELEEFEKNNYMFDEEKSTFQTIDITTNIDK